MAGLMPQERMSKPGPMATGGPARTSPMMPQSMAENAEDESNVAPEEQAQYDTFVKNGMRLIYNEQGLPKMVETLAGDGDPVEGLANALVTVVSRLEDSAKQSGVELSPDAKFHGAAELLEQMAELSEKAGIHQFTEQEMESALYTAFDQYRQLKQQQGTLDVEGLKQDAAELAAADQAGTTEEMLPGISEFAARGQQAAGAAPEEPPRRRGLMG